MYIYIYDICIKMSPNTEHRNDYINMVLKPEPLPTIKSG